MVIASTLALSLCTLAVPCAAQPASSAPAKAAIIASQHARGFI